MSSLLRASARVCAPLRRSFNTSSTRAADETHCPVLTMETLNPCIKVMEYAVRGPLVIRAPLRRSFKTSSSARAADETNCPVLTMETLNPCIKVMEYAVRGPLVIRAGQIEQELLNGQRKPFDEVIRANIGDAQAMGQVPITFFREVIALIAYPPLLDDPRFASDAKERAKKILAGCHSRSIGAYTDSSGIASIRRHVAEYIERRDGGITCDWQNVMLSSGATEAIKSILKLLNSDRTKKKSGVMVPIPQYPLYSATLAEFGMFLIGYYLDESKEWGLDVCELQRAYDESVDYCKPVAMVVINPGNPTGQVLSRNNMEEIIRFARDNRLFLLADEVYQDNIYAPGCKFHSMKKVLSEMGLPYSKMEVASFMSISKGYMGECGLRGGYVEIFNMEDEIRTMYLKSISAKLCASVIGQAVVDCVVNPPRPGDSSHERFACEKGAVLSSLATRATMVTDTFNNTPGMSCNKVQGAMYAFPQIRLPEKAVERARQIGIPADTMYAFELLENAGICIVPGSGFGQKEGTYHFRTTILPQPKKLVEMLKKFQDFHGVFMKKYQ